MRQRPGTARGEQLQQQQQQQEARPLATVLPTGSVAAQGRRVVGHGTEGADEGPPEVFPEPKPGCLKAPGGRADARSSSRKGIGSQVAPISSALPALRIPFEAAQQAPGSGLLVAPLAQPGMTTSWLPRRAPKAKASSSPGLRVATPHSAQATPCKVSGATRTARTGKEVPTRKESPIGGRAGGREVCRVRAS